MPNLGCALAIAFTLFSCLSGVFVFLFKTAAVVTVSIVNWDRGAVRLPGTVEPSASYRAPSYAVPILLLLFAGCGLLTALDIDSPRGTAVFGFLTLLGVLLFGLEYVSHAPSATERLAETDFLDTPRCYTIALPRQTEWQPDMAWRFVEHLVKMVPQAVLRIVAEPNRIAWQVIDWRAGVPEVAVIDAIHAYYPDAAVTAEILTAPDHTYPFSRYTLSFRQAGEFVWPIKGVGDLKHFDPLLTLTQAVAHLEPGEHIFYTLALSVPAHYAQA
ncbi:MAG: hypothetical protein H0T73_01125 [Ardenticatenales bacterium]|nr:hypothetical protein [Ardenticatenales bacterium]